MAKGGSIASGGGGKASGSGLHAAVKAVQAYGKEMNQERKGDYRVAAGAVAAGQANLAQQVGRAQKHLTKVDKRSVARLTSLTKQAKAVRRGVEASQADSVSRYGSALGQSVASQYGPARAAGKAAVMLAKGNLQQGKAGQKIGKDLGRTARAGVAAVEASANYALAQALQQRTIVDNQTLAQITGQLYNTALQQDQAIALEKMQENSQLKIAKLGYRHDKKMQQLTFAHDELMQQYQFSHDDATAAALVESQKEIAKYNYTLKDQEVAKQNQSAANQLDAIATNHGIEYAQGLQAAWLAADDADQGSPATIANSYMTAQGIDPKSNEGGYIMSLARNMYAAGAGNVASGKVTANEIPGIVSGSIHQTISELYPDAVSNVSADSIGSWINARTANDYYQSVYSQAGSGVYDPAQAGVQGSIPSWLQPGVGLSYALGGYGDNAAGWNGTGG